MVNSSEGRNSISGSRQSPKLMKKGACFTVSKVSPRGGAHYLLGGNLPSEIKWSPVREESSGGFMLAKPSSMRGILRSSVQYTA